MTTKSSKTSGWIVGIFLGLGAPAGSIFLKMAASGGASFSWVAQEISTHSYYYGYMALLTPLVFGLFGSYLGGLNDEIRAQKKKSESLVGVLEAQSMTDDVTGLYNHRHLMEEIEK